MFFFKAGITYHKQWDRSIIIQSSVYFFKDLLNAQNHMAYFIFTYKNNLSPHCLFYNIVA